MPKSSSGAAIKLTALHGFTGNGLDFSLVRDHLESLWDSNNGITTPYWNLPSLPGHEPRYESGYERVLFPEAGISPHIAISPNSPSTPSNPDEYYGWVKSLCEQNHNNEKDLNILVGYSLGARLALLHAVNNPSFWDGIILISANPGIIDDVERESRIVEDAELISMIEEKGLKHFLELWKEKPIIQSQKKAPKDFLNAMYKRKEALNTEGIKASLRSFGQGQFPNLWGKVMSIQSPSLLISGENDPKYSSISSAIVDHNDHASHSVIESSGHAPHIEAPKQVAQLIEQFIIKCWLSSTPSNF